MSVDISIGIAYGIKVLKEELYEGLKNYLLARPNIKYNPEVDDIKDYKEYVDEIICLNEHVSDSNYIIGYCINEVDEECEAFSLSDLQINYDDRYEIEQAFNSLVNDATQYVNRN